MIYVSNPIVLEDSKEIEEDLKRVKSRKEDFTFSDFQKKHEISYLQNYITLDYDFDLKRMEEISNMENIEYKNIEGKKLVEKV